MKEKPILFNTEMVQAILDGRKTQTRRQVRYVASLGEPDNWCQDGNGVVKGNFCEHSPFGCVGDRLWVRETFRLFDNFAECGCSDHCSCPVTGTPVYFASPGMNPNYSTKMDESKWKPSIHMPRWASRITLEITNIRVERLNSISDKDANAEGIQVWIESFNSSDFYHENGNLQAFPVTAFSRLWDSIYGNWSSNPWVWVVDFKRVAQ